MELEEDQAEGPADRPHHRDSHEVSPIVCGAMLRPEARRRLAGQLQRLAERREITRMTYLVGRVLVDLSKVTGATFPTLATISRRAYCCVRSVQRAIARLREVGILEWVRRLTRMANGRLVQTSNSYILTAPAEPSAPPREQSRPFGPLRYLRKVLESGSMDSVSIGNRTPAWEGDRTAAQEALAKVAKARESALAAAWRARQGRLVW